MPGYILHLTAAKMLLDHIPEASLLCRDKKEKNKFYVGCLLPDTVRVKEASHFRDPKFKEEMIEYPDLEMFRQKYGHLLKESSVSGYYFHLYVDRRFYKEYLPSIMEFLDEDENKVTKRAMVHSVFLKRQKKTVLKKDFYTDDFYYGDYTKMNTYLVEKYDLPVTLDIDIENPGIKEVDYADLKNVLEELESYLKVPAEEVRHLNVFNVKDVLFFLKRITLEFISGKYD